MKQIFLFIVLFLGCLGGQAQDVLHLTESMFDDKEGWLDLSDQEGWIFNTGNNTGFAAEDIDIDGWKPLKPAALTKKYADSAGITSGWFRIKIKLDSNLSTKLSGIANQTWSAADVYINGKKIVLFGNTGEDGEAYKDNNPMKKTPMRLSLLPDSVYTLSVRMIDKRKEFENKDLIVLTTDKYYASTLSIWSFYSFIGGITISITAILSLLFWLIYLLTAHEKNILRFAICSTLFMVLVAGFATSTSENITYASSTTLTFIIAFSVIGFTCYFPYMIAGIFKRKIPRPVTILLIASIVVLFFGISWAYFAPIIIALYYILTSFKKATKAQAVILIGFLLSIVFMFLQVVFRSDSKLMNTFVLFFIVSPLLGMLGYVAFRFKEMIQEIRNSSEKIIALSEEKRIQAENQKLLLQEEVDRQTLDLKNTLQHLKDTQNQLIHSEKMASLGELTAGVAHEIQNPLNFVKNFSEVSAELLDDLKMELEMNNSEEAGYIADDVKQNLTKIVHHSNRADSIVKGMLQHSRNSTGERMPTDINALVDEYLRLGYHGLRAKDKTFNAAIETGFDQSIGKLHIVQQDIGRVVLNLVTNALYAVNEKRKEGNGDYTPKISVSTAISGGAVLISVKDNGGGIPEKIKEKIFQPFFTTKPTGEGTGLGLSLAYDIVKAHNGKLTVEAKTGEGTTFTIFLPV